MKNYKKYIFSSLFQYSEIIIGSTETNNTLEESSDIQFFAAGKFKGVALSGACQTPTGQERAIFHVCAVVKFGFFQP